MAEKNCFVISPIGKEDSKERKRADQIYNHILDPIVSNLGYNKPIRADKIAQPGVITIQIVERLMNCDLVIADLTDHNPNVMNTLATALIDLRSEVRQRTSYRSGLLSPTLNPNPQAVTSPDTKREAEVDMKEEGIGLSEGE